MRTPSNAGDEAGFKDLIKPNAPTVYQTIAHDGEEEMRRPAVSLWWSGVAAGLAISISLFAMAAIKVAFGDAPSAEAISKFGYCIGFLIVILGRLQLFTENTITPVLPVLRKNSLATYACVGRIWLIVFTANLVGTLLAALLALTMPMLSPEQADAVLEISRHFAERDLYRCFASGIPAGFLVAAMVWMMPSSQNFQFFTIVAMTYVIAVTDTSHVIVGSTELFILVLSGELSILAAALKILATGLGNIIGGTGLFALLAYGQVSEEI